MHENLCILRITGSFSVDSGVKLLPRLKHPEKRLVCFTAPVVIRPPNGESFPAIASFNTEHILFIGGKGEYGISVSIKNIEKEKIKEGCEILINQQTKDMLESGTASNG